MNSIRQLAPFRCAKLTSCVFIWGYFLKEAMNKKLNLIAAQLEVYADAIRNAGEEPFALVHMKAASRYLKKSERELTGEKPKAKKILSEDEAKEGKAFAQWFNKNCTYKLNPSQAAKAAEIYHELKSKGYDKDKVKRAVLFAVNDQFWKANFRTPMKLLKKDKEGTLYIDLFLSLSQEETRPVKTYNPHV